ncbi:conjugal transfer protein TraD [Sphingopyxis sp. YR583]|uniref:conjugal transfer protein TraD n=1 Tax=Sphingopyxis sp. YR583 TaxID=1881047 RepID=UPI000B8951AB|nr:conjugal transfer protein TraD [Sphingopyxis sp. YR583]
MTRRARTRQLIELGGLVMKAGLAQIAGDDRALIYGAFLEIAARLQEPNGDALRADLHRSGARALADEANIASSRIGVSER